MIAHTQLPDLQKRNDVGLGTSVHCSNSVYTLNTWFADSGTGSSPIHRVRKLSDEWSFHTGSFYPLLCSHLHLLVSCWSPHVHWFIIIAFLNNGERLMQDIQFLCLVYVFLDVWDSISLCCVGNLKICAAIIKLL